LSLLLLLLAMGLQQVGRGGEMVLDVPSAYQRLG
jgi:hypothetical protein